jgi:tRNA(Met) C34 N-acetyltransferase TmcA
MLDHFYCMLKRGVPFLGAEHDITDGLVRFWYKNKFTPVSRSSSTGGRSTFIG